MSSVTFERHAFRVADARNFALQFLAEAQAPGEPTLSARVLEAAQLVVSELVTNAVKYGSGPIGLSVALAEDTLSVTVRDGETTLPSRRPADPRRVGQHGLEIVAALSRDIEVRQEETGKRVTARIALDEPRGLPYGRG
ncbi:MULTISPECIES: ATP-binding protein [Streptomyces]|jgi:anti-sigma regulatory factor (Ser/Thr protein kinase)|uniref:ATP-binding protein n=1 Tax=Streptomyces TaxID=1883 RepID=UPI001EFB3262|nr:ATP-binding protein [Streptomyces sp. CL12-4]MCG8965250.1 ATP-binding protein [Streptomyces sp. CL12-4]